MQIQILKPGLLVRDAFGNILEASSTVTLIQTTRHKIIVDTGTPENDTGGVLKTPPLVAPRRTTPLNTLVVGFARIRAFSGALPTSCDFGYGHFP